VAGSGVLNTPDVTMTYDEVGNRLSMTDGLGTVAYEYDTLSRLFKETMSED
jgi:YD repeat-containing protein